jgi:hypothetical protein
MQKDRHDEANSHISPFCEPAYNNTYLGEFGTRINSGLFCFSIEMNSTSAIQRVTNFLSGVSKH